MRRTAARTAILLGLLSAAGCSTPHLIVSRITGSSLDITGVAAACAGEDVVFFGEEHDSDECHEAQRQFIIALHKSRPDLVISMEMFERDVQEQLDAYLAGKLPEKEFRETARAWQNWHHYRPIVQYAAMHDLPVIAANAPKELVQKVSRGGGLEAVEGEDQVAREVLAPKDEYYSSFVRAMTGEDPTEDDERWDDFYTAQVLRDETMAESITDYLSAAHREGRKPIVVHLCGNFHSAYGRGTVSRVIRRSPDLSVKVIATSSVEELRVAAADEELGDFHLLVRSRPSSEGAAAAHPSATSDPVHQPAPPPVHEQEEEATGRPGLGFMPAYDGTDLPGVSVESVRAGGPAAKAGIEPGDLIVELAGEELEDLIAYTEILGGLRIGQKVEVSVLRGDQRVELEVVVGRSNR